MSVLSLLVDLSKPLLWLTLALTIFAPTYWNTVARLQYRTGAVTKLFGGSTLVAIYVFAASIFTVSGIRDYVFVEAIKEQPRAAILDNGLVVLLGYLLIAVGMTFVVTSFFKLGLVGTYLGDYFGILMKERVTSFPFNVLEHPMYVGSTLNFVGTSLTHASLVGLGLSAFIYVVYMIASVFFEGPFTTQIYANASQKNGREARGPSPNKTKPKRE
eukprot:TRINITY_DN1398_c0_g1_i1.p1 TRINITY_DN1398_c0_g1~~TRINITY_DN1398_c0_g1_i1.p1  ORF type:complete len:215 (+),score=60.12 TRINITY_DN1398_c0_g1_i1:136-780(+)